MRLFAIPFVLASLALAGCASVPSGNPITVPNITGTSLTAPGGVTDAIRQVQTTAQQNCSFVPTAQTVANVLSMFGVPGVDTATSIANQICSAVGKAGSRRGVHMKPVIARGGKRVVIEGKHVR